MAGECGAEWDGPTARLGFGSSGGLWECGWCLGGAGTVAVSFLIGLFICNCCLGWPWLGLVASSLALLQVPRVAGGQPPVGASACRQTHLGALRAGTQPDLLSTGGKSPSWMVGF